MSQPGDALGATKDINHGSAADKYYAWKLMADKMMISASSLGAEAKAVLGASSQKEEIKFKILNKLVGNEYDETSAKYAQLCQYTGKEEKLEQAEFLANEVFNNLRGKRILEELVGGENDFANTMKRTAVSLSGTFK